MTSLVDINIFPWLLLYYIHIVLYISSLSATFLSSVLVTRNQSWSKKINYKILEIEAWEANQLIKCLPCVSIWIWSPEPMWQKPCIVLGTHHTSARAEADLWCSITDTLVACQVLEQWEALLQKMVGRVVL